MIQRWVTELRKWWYGDEGTVTQDPALQPSILVAFAPTPSIDPVEMSSLPLMALSPEDRKHNSYQSCVILGAPVMRLPRA